MNGCGDSSVRDGIPDVGGMTYDGLLRAIMWDVLDGVKHEHLRVMGRPDAIPSSDLVNCSTEVEDVFR